MSSSANQNPPKRKSEMSQYQWLKQSSWGSLYHFMLSYNLRIYEEEDVQEAKRIIAAFRENEDESDDCDMEQEAGEGSGGQGMLPVGRTRTYSSATQANAGGQQKNAQQGSGKDLSSKDKSTRDFTENNHRKAQNGGGSATMTKKTF